MCAEPPVGEVVQAVGAVQAVQAVLVQGGKPMAFDASLPVASAVPNSAHRPMEQYLQHV